MFFWKNWVAKFFIFKNKSFEKLFIFFDLLEDLGVHIFLFFIYDKWNAFFFLGGIVPSQNGIIKKIKIKKKTHACTP
jgi:hypothetical protein